MNIVERPPRAVEPAVEDAGDLSFVERAIYVTLGLGLAATAAQGYADQAAEAIGGAVHAATGGAIDPIVFRLAIIVLAIWGFIARRRAT